MINQPPPELFPERPVRSEFARKRARSGMRFIVVGFVFLVLAGGLGLYVKLTGEGEVKTAEIPTIKSEGPLKQRPEEPGGIDIPHQDVLVFQQIDGNEADKAPVEHLLPPPETPQPIVIPQLSTSQYSSSPSSTAPTSSVPPSNAPPTSAQATTPPAQNSNVVSEPTEPTTSAKPAAVPGVMETLLDGSSRPNVKMQTTVIDQNASSSASPSAPPSAATPAVSSSPSSALSAPASPPATPSASPPTPSSLPSSVVISNSAAASPVSQSTSGATSQHQHSTTPGLARVASLSPSSQSNGQAHAVSLSKTKTASDGFHIQLASLIDQGAAEGEKHRLEAKYAAVLGQVKLHVRKADLGAKGVYYRIESGSLSDTEASTICASLQSKKAGCIVVRP